MTPVLFRGLCLRCPRTEDAALNLTAAKEVAGYFMKRAYRVRILGGFAGALCS